MNRIEIKNVKKFDTDEKVSIYIVNGIFVDSLYSEAE